MNRSLRTYFLLLLLIGFNQVSRAAQLKAPTPCKNGLGGYATWVATSGSNSGTGTFTNADPYFSVTSDFTWEVSGDFDSVSISSSEVFTGSNSLESIYGEADLASNLNVRVSSNEGKGSNPPIVSTAVTTITFDSPTASEGLAFAISDLDVDQVRITAKDNEGVDVSVETIDSWIIELFDTNDETNGVEEPFWDPNEPALIGVNAGSTIWRTTAVNGGGTSSPAAWFQVNMSLSQLTFELQPTHKSATPSLHYYLASCLDQLADIEVKKISLNAEYTPGGFDTYIIEVINHGPSGVQNISIYDLLDNGVNLLGWVCTVKQTGTGTIPTKCNIESGITNPISLTADLANNGSIEITISVQYSALPSDY